MLLRASGTGNISCRVTSETQKPFRIVTLDLNKPDLPSALDRYRIVQLSDFHFGPCTSAAHIRRAVSITSSLEPDLVLLTGDYVQYSNTGFTHLLAKRVNPKVFHWKEYRRVVRRLSVKLCDLLSPLSPSDGVYAIFGNHDYSEGLGTVRRKLSPAVTWLRNSSVSITRAGSSIAIAGLDDIRYGEPDIDKTLAFDTAAQDGAIKILLSHSPDVVTLDDSALLHKVDLVLCGHTHGGQICLPGGIPVVTRTRRRNFASGIAEFEGIPVYINSGIGYGAVPLRLFCPPEITLITLRRE